MKFHGVASSGLNFRSSGSGHAGCNRSRVPNLIVCKKAHKYCWLRRHEEVRESTYDLALCSMVAIYLDRQEENTDKVTVSVAIEKLGLQRYIERS